MSTPFITRNGGARIDTTLLLNSGVIEGPYRVTKPVTLTFWTRVRCWVRQFITRR